MNVLICEERKRSEFVDGMNLFHEINKWTPAGAAPHKNLWFLLVSAPSLLFLSFSSFFSLLNGAEHATIQLKKEDKLNCLYGWLWLGTSPLAQQKFIPQFFWIVSFPLPCSLMGSWREEMRWFVWKIKKNKRWMKWGWWRSLLGSKLITIHPVIKKLVFYGGGNKPFLQSTHFIQQNKNKLTFFLFSFIRQLIEEWKESKSIITVSISMLRKQT